MNSVVTLKELENMLDVKFPRTFHEIYNSGAMEWLTHTYDWLNKNRATVEADIEAFFYSVGGDCEPIIFPEIQETINYFEEMLEYDEDYKLGKVKINPKYRFIPFAQMGSGDLYCFWYEESSQEPKITVYGHDTGDMDLWANNFDEFLFIQLGTSVVDWGDNINNDSIQAHTKFLTYEYKKLFQSEDEEKIKSIIEAMGKPKQIEYLV
ncbi:SMI1/KNR4 family protein [Clostridium sp. YIM B02505]|uniref:SMI1/KNR4 family protein n=1 Tax=Clostridium yunnanense TaxID=2800325 RepID=A0ABS1EN26_9CLOT|nr:SMI1/KNR4 family protein [Clostridium yunnanense]MBK1810818.1 SMI1/KNR4 family protein [Clostridium yunnanense]